MFDKERLMLIFVCLMRSSENLALISGWKIHENMQSQGEILPLSVTEPDRASKRQHLNYAERKIKGNSSNTYHATFSNTRRESQRESQELQTINPLWSSLSPLRL